MTTAITSASNLPTDPKTGLTPLLSRYLGSPELKKHRALIAWELEVIGKKLDRFGWERDRGTALHDRLVTDWMAALQDYPLDEVQAACRAWLEANARQTSPRRVVNEGDIKALIVAARRPKVRSLPQPEPERERPSWERATEIRREVERAANSKRVGA